MSLISDKLILVSDAVTCFNMPHVPVFLHHTTVDSINSNINSFNHFCLTQLFSNLSICASFTTKCGILVSFLKSVQL